MLPASFSLSRKTIFAGTFLLLALGLFNFFFLLGSEKIHDWDEARHGVSAYEMLATGNYIVNTYNFQTDYWNVKPPLSIWATAFSFKIFGFNVFALRFFSALSSTVTLLMIMLFTGRQLSWFAAFTAGTVFITLSGFIFAHNARSGDPDAIFIMFSTGAILCAILSKDKNWLIPVSALLLSLAFLTKSFHVLSPLLTVLIMLIWNHGRRFFSLKFAGGFLLAGIVPSLIWAAFRYSYDGLQFFQIMLGYDVLERSLNPVEGHTGSAAYYLQVLHNDFRRYYVLIISMLCIMVFLIKKKHYAWSKTVEFANSRLVFQLLVCAAVPVILFSCAASKLAWYVYPAFPFIAVLIGCFISSIIAALKNMEGFKKLSTVAVIFVVIYFCVLEAQYIIKLNRNASQIDPVQQLLLVNIHKLQKFNNSHIYLETGNWDQRLLLAAKLSAGLVPQSGGRNAWEQDPANAILITQDLRLHDKNGAISVEAPY